MVTKGYGLTVDDIDQSCPTDLEPYAIAYKEQMNVSDAQNWQLGQYILASIESVFSKNAKYPKKPMFQIASGIAESGCKEGQEEVAVFEMKQRTKMLEKSGLMQSPM